MAYQKIMRKRCRCPALGWLLLFLWVFSVRETVAQHLAAYLREAAANNPGLRASYANFQAAVQKAAQAGQLPDPTVSVGYFLTPVETRVGPQQLSFGLSQNLPGLGYLTAQKKAEQLRADAAYKHFEDAKNTLYLQVKKAWYALYENREHQQLQTKHEALLQNLARAVLIQIEQGHADKTEGLRVDLKIHAVSVALRVLADEEKVLRLRFNRLLHRDGTTAVALPDTLSLQVLVPYAGDGLSLANHPALQALSLQAKASTLQKKVVRGKRWPRIGFGFRYTVVGDARVMPGNGRDIIMPTVQMSLPLWGIRAAQRAAAHTQAARIAAREDFENSLSISYANAWQQANKAYQMAELYTAQQAKTEEILVLLLSAYANGAQSIQELLAQQEALLAYEIAKQAAVRSYYVAVSTMDYLTAKDK